MSLPGLDVETVVFTKNGSTLHTVTFLSPLTVSTVPLRWANNPVHTVFR